MEPSELRSEIDTLLRGLRACDTQTTAVAWMKRAYVAMEHCLKQLEDRPERLVFIPERPALQVVQSVTAFDVKEAEARREELRRRSLDQTVIYPEVFRHPGLKPLPKPWTREDTRRLERAVKARHAPIQRRGR